MLETTYTIVDVTTGKFLFINQEGLQSGPLPRKSMTTTDPSKAPNFLAKAEKSRLKMVTLFKINIEKYGRNTYYDDELNTFESIKPKIIEISYRVLDSEDKCLLAIKHGGNWKDDNE